jgi:hypothetical protein
MRKRVFGLAGLIFCAPFIAASPLFGEPKPPQKDCDKGGVPEQIECLRGKVIELEKKVAGVAGSMKVCVITYNISGPTPRQEVVVVNVPHEWRSGNCERMFDVPSDHGRAWFPNGGPSERQIVEGCLFPDGRVSVPAHASPPNQPRIVCGW